MTERSLKLDFNDQQCFTTHISPMDQSGWFSLISCQRMWCSSLSKLLSFQDWTTAVFNWPALSHSATKPLQMIQNMAALLVFNQPKKTRITPLMISLHWLIVAARVRFEALTLAFRTATGLAHSYFNALLQVIVIERGVP